MFSTVWIFSRRCNVSICNGVHYVSSWQSHICGPLGSMLNGKVSKMSSLIEEAFKLVPFPNLDHS